MRKAEKAKITVKIDPEVWRRTRIYCLEQSMTAGELIERLLRAELKIR